MSAPFSAALADPAVKLPGLTTWNGSDPDQRFNIYRNNVAVSLRAALETTFPITRQLVGEEFFAGMARAYIECARPRSPIMARYGDTFGDFIAGFEPATSLPYLADVARLEFLRVEAFHAADAEPLGAQEFAALDSIALPATSVTLHPAARILRSPYPVVSIWAAHHGEGSFEEIDLAAPEDVLIARPALRVRVQRLEPGVAAALLALAGGAPIAEAADAAVADTEAFMPAALFSTLITAGIALALRLGDVP